jgi:hypothetical protein
MLFSERLIFANFFFQAVARLHLTSGGLAQGGGTQMFARV